MQIQTYYTLVEKNTARVSRLWKSVHIILLFTAALSGFITCYTIGRINTAFGGHCVLYAEIVFESPTTTFPPLLIDISTESVVSNASKAPGNSSLSPFINMKIENGTEERNIDMTGSVWGTYGMCSFCQFTPLMSMIFASCWLMFFFMCGPGGAGYPSDLLSKPWHVVYPALIFSLIFSIILSVSTVHISNGLTQFCTDFKERVIFNVYRCIPEIDEFTRIFWGDQKKGAYIQTILCFLFAHVGLIAWWVQTIILILRIFCVADFDMLVVRKISKTESQLLQTRIQEPLKSKEDTYTMMKPKYKNVIISAPSKSSHDIRVNTDLQAV